MDLQSPKLPSGFCLRLAVYPPSQVLQTERCFSHVTSAFHVVRGGTASRVPLLRSHYAASSLVRPPPPPSPLRPLSRALRLYGLPCSADFAAGGGGLLQLLEVSWSPCCRFHPAGVRLRASQPTRPHAAFVLPVADSASGATHFRGHFCVRLRYGPVTCRHPMMTLSDGLQVLGFPPPCHPSYRASGFYPGGTGSR
jgi:hypothetical protein